MANPSDKQMLRDANGDLIPQYWDVVAGEFKPLTGSDGANDVRLTGSIVEEEVIFDRQILTENSGNSRLFRPNNAKGFIVYLYIYGITGNFSTNDGVRLRIRNYGYTIGRHFSSYNTRVTTTGNRLHVALMYPGVEESSAMGLTSGASYIAVNSVATNNLRVEVEVDGTFDVGEGVDCEVGIEWIL